LFGLISLCDFCLIVTGAAIVFFLFPLMTGQALVKPENYLLTSLLAATLFVSAFQRVAGYTLRHLSDLRWQLVWVTTIWAIVVSALLVLAFLAGITDIYSRGWTISWIAIVAGSLLTERSFQSLAIDRLLRPGYIARHIAIVGTTDAARRLLAKVRKSEDKSIAIYGVFDESGLRGQHSVDGYAVLGNTDDLVQVIRQRLVEEVIIALPTGSDCQLKRIIDKLKVLSIDLRLSTDSLVEGLAFHDLSHVGDAPLLVIADQPIKHWSAVAKWIEDKLLATLLLIALAPLMGIIAVLIKWDSPGPVLFKQERFGFNDSVFQVLKFRTMYVDRNDISGAQRTVRNDPRVTRVGRILRLRSLDELPQLLNVLRGEMSLVGPRPHATAMRAGNQRYSDAILAYSQRHRVKPGITGWAQVHGYRGEVDTMDKARARFEHDLYYIENWSILLDLKTLVLTVPALFVPRNAY
jgi:Undecaprenyl-phosphate glucose phosphotransferase